MVHCQRTPTPDRVRAQRVERVDKRLAERTGSASKMFCILAVCYLPIGRWWLSSCSCGGRISAYVWIGLLDEQTSRRKSAGTSTDQS